MNPPAAARAHPPHSIAAMRHRHGPNYRWWLLVTVMVGTMASIMASTIVNVAVPDMSHHFTLGQERAQWLTAGFMAAVTVSMLATPWLLERFGYRRLYAAMVLLLMAGGIGGGLGQSFGWVMAMRVVEGVAAGVMQPIPAIIVLHAFGMANRGKAMGIFGFGVVLAPAIGPSVGGVLVEHFGWRSIFFVVVPFCLVALAMSHRFLPHVAPGGQRVNAHGHRFDALGFVLVTVAVISGLNGLVQLHEPSKLPAVLLLTLAAGSATAFVLHQRRSPNALMKLALFDFPAFRMGSVVAFTYGMALFGSTYLVPVFMQIALKLPPSQAGGVLLPAGIVLAFTIPLVARQVGRFPPARIVAVGLALLSASFLLMATVGLQTTLWVITAWAIVGRIGLGCVLPSLNLGAMAGVDTGLFAHGSSTINFMRQLGGAVGVNVAGIVLEWRLKAEGNQTLVACHETFVFLGVLTGLAMLAAWRMRGPLPPAGTEVPETVR